MAAKKSVTGESPSSSQAPHITQLIKACNIPNNIQIRPISPYEADKWKASGLDENLLILGKKHNETIRLPIHSLILQFLSALCLHPMQLTLNSLKFLVASIILNEVEGKNITVEDLLFVFNVKKTPTKPGNPRGHSNTYYLSASKNYYMFSGSASVDKDWESAGGFYVISGEWIPQGLDRTYFPLVIKFSMGKNDWLSSCYYEYLS